MVKAFLKTSRHLLLIGAVATVLTGCDTVSGWFQSEKKRLPGERISVLSLDSAIRPDPSLEGEELRLPRPYKNLHWPGTSGYPSHVMHHLALGDVPQERFNVEVGSGSYGDRRMISAPIVAAGVIYSMDLNGRVAAHSAKTGRQFWRKSIIPRGEQRQSALGGGLAFYQGTLYVSSPYGALLALDGKTGKLKWYRRVGAPFRMAPTVAEGRVIAVSVDNEVYAYSTEGKQLWTVTGIASSVGLLGGGAPAVTKDMVVVPFSSGELYGIRAANGRVLWTASLTRSTNLSPVSKLADINGNPAIYENMVVAGSHGGRIVALDLNNGSQYWSQDISTVQTPWVAGDYVFVVSTDAEVVALSRKDGRIQWVTKLPRYEDEDDPDPEELLSWYGPVLASDRLLLANSLGEVWALSPYTGQSLGYIETDEEIRIAPVIANGSLFLLRDDGTLSVMR